jgi:hypothetical protein
VIKLKIIYKFDVKDKAPHNLHVHFLQFMITNINFNVTVYSNNHEVFKVTDIMTLIDPEKNFDINVSKRDRHEETKKALIIQTIQSSSALSCIKKQLGVIHNFEAKKFKFRSTNGQTHSGM